MNRKKSHPFPLVIDTDTAGDDITALILALQHTPATVVGITTVAGNVPVDRAAYNARAVLEMLGRSDVPVYLGSPAPLVRPLSTTTHIQGREGLGHATLPEPRSPVQDIPAAQALLHLSRIYPSLTILAIGPLTNLALALRLDPDFPQRVAQVVIMGGTWQGRGNQTPVSEYNFWQDPEAAHAVLHAGWPITLVPWETVLQDGVLPPEREVRFAASGNPMARFFLQVHQQAKAFDQAHWGVAGSLHPDALTAAVALEPDLVQRKVTTYLTVLTHEGLTRGMTVPDPYGLLQRGPNVEVVLAIHRHRFWDLLEDALLRTNSS